MSSSENTVASEPLRRATENRSFQQSMPGRGRTHRLAAVQASVDTGLGRDPESVRKMRRSLLNWDPRPRYPELLAPHEPRKTLELMF